MSSTMRKTIVRTTALVMLCCVAAVLAVTSRDASADQSPVYGSWAPSLANLSEAGKLPVVTAPGGELAAVIQKTASATGGDPSVALSTLRLLRSDLGVTHAALYTYAPSDGAVCVVLWQRQGTCPTAGSSETPGVELILSPGGPGYVGQSDNVPPAIGGVASDLVQSVALVDNGIETALPIENNAFFTDLHEPPNATFTVDVVIHYKDGSTINRTLTQPGPFQLSANGAR